MRVRFSMAGLILVITVAGWMYGRQEEPVIHALADAKARLKASTVVTVDPSMTPKPMAADARLSKNFDTDRRAAQQAIALVGEKWPHLDRFVLLRSKALPSAKDRAEMQDYLTGPDLELDARAALVAGDALAHSNVGEFARLYSMQAIKQALDLPDSGQRERLRNLLVDLVKADRIPAAADPELKNSLAADQMQSLLLLKQKFPEAYEDLLKNPLPAGSQTIVRAFARDPGYYEKLFR